ELALEALVDDLVLLRRREPAGVLVVEAVDEREQRRERRAELEAESTTVTQVVDTRELLTHIGFVQGLGMMRVVRRRHGGAPGGSQLVGVRRWRGTCPPPPAGHGVPVRAPRGPAGSGRRGSSRRG